MDRGGDQAGCVVGEMIKQSRRDRQLSQRMLAARLRDLANNPAIDQSAVSRWENGDRIPGPCWLIFLSRALDIPLSALERGVRAAKRRRLEEEDP